MKVAESRDAPHEGVEQACGNDKKKEKKGEWVRRTKKKMEKGKRVIHSQWMKGKKKLCCGAYKKR